MMRRGLLVFLVLIAVGGNLNAQSFYYKLLAPRLGYQQLAPFQYSRWGGTLYYQDAVAAPSLTVGPVLDLRFYDFSDESSIGILAEPSIGFYMPMSLSYAFGILEDFSLPLISKLPLFVQYNTGNFSTSGSSKEKGFGFGLGVNLFRIRDSQYSWQEQFGTDFIGGGREGVLLGCRFSYRYWNDRNQLKTLNISYSVGGRQNVGAQEFRRHMIEFSFPAFDY